MSSKLRYDLDIGQAYNFTLLGATILGSGYRGATLMAVLDYGSAAPLADVGSLHAKVLSALPTGTPSDPSLLIYLKFKSSTGDIVVVAQDWLAATPEDATVTSLTVVIDGTAASDVAKIRAMLTANGYLNFTIS